LFLPIRSLRFGTRCFPLAFLQLIQTLLQVAHLLLYFVEHLLVVRLWLLGRRSVGPPPSIYVGSPTGRRLAGRLICFELELSCLESISSVFQGLPASQHGQPWPKSSGSRNVSILVITRTQISCKTSSTSSASPTILKTNPFSQDQLRVRAAGSRRYGGNDCGWQARSAWDYGAGESDMLACGVPP